MHILLIIAPETRKNGVLPYSIHGEKSLELSKTGSVGPPWTRDYAIYPATPWSVIGIGRTRPNRNSYQSICLQGYFICHVQVNYDMKTIEGWRKLPRDKHESEHYLCTICINSCITRMVGMIHPETMAWHSALWNPRRLVRLTFSMYAIHEESTRQIKQWTELSKFAMGSNSPYEKKFNAFQPDPTILIFDHFETTKIGVISGQSSSDLSMQGPQPSPNRCIAVCRPLGVSS